MRDNIAMLCSVKYFLLIPLICLIAVNDVFACELDQTQHGCRINDGQCTCAFGCKSEFRYATRRECQDALKGKTNDVCGRVPCLNNGSCIQISQMPGFKCRCEGSGYWGNKCQKACPTPDQNVSNFPYECIVI